MADLDERKKLILRAIVEDYIKNAEPVGSRTIAKKTGLNLSAATIRNEMGDLEEMGMLIQPHTSAGRIPSNAGLRFYVDNLMDRYQMTAIEIGRLKRALIGRFKELDNIVREASSAFSAVTNMPTFAITPISRLSGSKSVKLANIDGRNIMVIVSNSAGIIKNKLLRLRKTVTDQEVERMNRIISEHISGIGMGGYANLDSLIGALGAVGENTEIFASVLELIHEAEREIDSKQVFVEGAANILRFPEYNDVEKIKNILEFFDDKNVLSEAIDAIDISPEGEGVSIYIGDELPLPQLKENSIIVSRYSVGNDLIGIVGVIGPQRMDYAKVMSGIKYLSDTLSAVLNDRLGPGRETEEEGDG